MQKSPNIILIGGVPTAGKTTLAEQLSKELGIPWISTDQIRTIMKSSADESRSSDLFITPSDHASIEEIVDQEIKRAEIIWRGVCALIERYHPWNGCIIEGAAILPQLVKRDLGERTEIKILFLVHTNIDRITKIVEERSTLPFIKTKTQAQQQSKVKEIQLLNERIRIDAEAHGFVTIEAHTEQTLNDVIKALV